MNAILFQPTGEVRRPKKDDYFLHKGMIYRASAELYDRKKYPIYARHEIPAEVAQRMMEEAKP